MILFVAVNRRSRFSFVIPTPFAKNPFEFTVGFRNIFYLFALAYGLTIIAVVVDNFNLGVFALILTLVAPCSFYVKPENPYYVWQFSRSPAPFLYYKMKTALIYSLKLSFPVILILSLFYIENIGILFFCFFLGYAFLVLFIFIKVCSFSSRSRHFGGYCDNALHLLSSFAYHYDTLLFQPIGQATSTAFTMIETVQLSKQYGTVQALQNVCLRFEDGKTVGIVGENGAGKTTLFRCMARLETYDGKILSNWNPLKNYLGFYRLNLIFSPK